MGGVNSDWLVLVARSETWAACSSGCNEVREITCTEGYWQSGQAKSSTMWIS